MALAPQSEIRTSEAHRAGIPRRATQGMGSLSCSHARHPATMPIPQPSSPLPQLSDILIAHRYSHSDRPSPSVRSILLHWVCHAMSKKKNRAPSATATSNSAPPGDRSPNVGLRGSPAATVIPTNERQPPKIGSSSTSRKHSQEISHCNGDGRVWS